MLRGPGLHQQRAVFGALPGRDADCDILWQIRNQIYHENGYCFRTPRGMRAFGNAGCRHDDVNEVRLNQFERANVATVARVERIKGCAG